MDIAGILRAQIGAFYPLEAPVLDALTDSWEEIMVKRKTVLTPAGTCEQYLYLALEGIQHAVYQHGDKEATLVFSYPYSFSGIVDSFLLQKPATCRLETITKSRLLRMHRTTLMALIAHHPSIETWLWHALAAVLEGTLLRQGELLLTSAEEKFINLMKRSPQVLNLIPHKYLASYIGVDASTFSKLLGNVRL